MRRHRQIRDTEQVNGVSETRLWRHEVFKHAVSNIKIKIQRAKIYTDWRDASISIQFLTNKSLPIPLALPFPPSPHRQPQPPPTLRQADLLCTLCRPTATLLLPHGWAGLGLPSSRYQHLSVRGRAERRTLLLFRSAARPSRLIPSIPQRQRRSLLLTRRRRSLVRSAGGKDLRIPLPPPLPPLRLLFRPLPPPFPLFRALCRPPRRPPLYVVPGVGGVDVPGHQAAVVGGKGHAAVAAAAGDAPAWLPGRLEAASGRLQAGAVRRGAGCWDSPVVVGGGVGVGVVGAALVGGRDEVLTRGGLA